MVDIICIIILYTLQIMYEIIVLYITSKRSQQSCSRRVKLHKQFLLPKNNLFCQSFSSLYWQFFLKINDFKKVDLKTFWTCAVQILYYWTFVCTMIFLISLTLDRVKEQKGNQYYYRPNWKIFQHGVLFVKTNEVLDSTNR